MTAEPVVARQWRSHAACREVDPDIFFPTAEHGRMRAREVAAANVIRFLFGIAFFGSLLLFPSYFQQAIGKTPFQSGLFLIPQTLGAAAVMPVVGRLLEKRGPRLIVLSGDAVSDRARADGVEHLPMTCHSGGALEVYVEPCLPKPLLLMIPLPPMLQ